MLVLSRKESQRIRLGDSIVVTIVKISGDKVRVGIEAPSDVLVLRDELEVRTGAAPSAAAPESGTTPAGVSAADRTAADRAALAPLQRSA
jgi:carbon storage regulator